MKKISIISVILIIIDVIIKRIVICNFVLNKSIMIIDNFLYLTYTHNTGAAFSILDNNTLLITVITIIIIGYLVYYLRRIKDNNKLEVIGYSLILGGAIGNLIDRIIYGYVIDFIDIYIYGYDFPIFNMADIFITVGVIVLLIEGLGKKNDNKCR